MTSKDRYQVTHSRENTIEKSRRSVPRFGILSSRMMKDIGSTQRDNEEGRFTEVSQQNLSHHDRSPDQSPELIDHLVDSKFVIDYGSPDPKKLNLTQAEKN